MSMMLELSSRMIDYLPEEVAKIQRTVEIALSESKTEEEMFSIVDKQLSTEHLREGAREFWDVFSNASDYAEPLTEGVGGFPVDRSNILKNRAKDRNVGRVMDVNGQQVLVINKRSNGDYVVVTKDGKRMTKKGDILGATRTEKVELNLLDTIEEEDMSASESPNGTKKKAGKTTVIINPKASDLMKEANKDYDGDGKVESGAKEHAGAVHNAIQRKKGGKPDGKDTTNIKEKIDVGADAGKTISDFVHSKAKTFEGDSKKQRIKRALGAYYGAQKEEVEIEEAAQGPCWKGYQQYGMKKKNGKEVPNCVPKEEYEELVGQLVSEGYSDEQVREILEAIEDDMEVIFEENGYTIISEEVLEEQFYEDVELVANWLQEEGIIETEDEFFSLMDDLTEEEIDELYDVVMEATAMAKRGYDETSIRNKVASNTQGGAAADRAKALADKQTYGQRGVNPQARQRYARSQMSTHRQTTSSNPGLHGYGHQSNDPKVKAKQAARGAQRGSATLTPNEKKQLNMGDTQMIGNSLEEGGMEVRTYSWRDVMGEAWKGSKKGGNKSC